MCFVAARQTHFLSHIFFISIALKYSSKTNSYLASGVTYLKSWERLGSRNNSTTNKMFKKIIIIHATLTGFYYL